MHEPPTSPSRADPTRGLIFLLSASCAIAAANLYYVQPLAGPIGRDYGLPASEAGLLVTATQLGYALGLVLVVPLGDIVENRRLILAMLGALVVALICGLLAPNAGLFLAASLAIGISASAVQVIVPFAGHLASDDTRGRVVGNVVGGLLFGIMLSRPAASFAAHAIGDRSIFGIGAILVLGSVGLLVMKLPTRRPHGMPYGAALASLWPLLKATPVLQRRSAYQAAMFGAFSVFWTAAPLFLEGPAFHFTQIDIGLFALVGAGGALVSPLAGRAADAGHTHRVTGLAMGAAVLSFVVAFVAGHLVSWPLLVAAALVLDMAVAANLVVGQREIFALGPEVRSRLNGLYLALFFLGGALGSFLAGIAFAHSGWSAASLVGLLFPAIAMAYYATERT